MENLNRLILHPDFEKTLKELSDKNIFLPYQGSWDTPHILDIQTSGQLLKNIEDIKSYKLHADNGCVQNKIFSYAAYDESIMKFLALEGFAFFTAHSLVVLGEDDYIPVSLVTFNFFTRAKAIVAKSVYIKFAEEPEIEYKRQYMKDRIAFLLDCTPKNTLLFIDGPLIGGDLYTILIDQNKKFLEKGILPIYFVKNSASSIITQHIKDLQGKYNSDMHWLQTLLKPGERSSFFQYEDQVNPKNSKIFCYLKAYESSPQRIEFHVDTYTKYKDSIQNIMDLIYYLLLVQGNRVNPQIRPIAIAEAYAREILAFIDINKYFKEIKISPTINQIRFGGVI